VPLQQADLRRLLTLSAKIKRVCRVTTSNEDERPVRPAAGRPQATSHAAIEEAAFSLFTAHGFDATTTDEIAEAAGVGRRTLFRYFPSKNDIPWGQFDDSLDFFRDALAAMPRELPVWDAVRQGVVLFNSFDPHVLPQHRERMRLILRTPSLQAHSALMYERWRTVIVEFVAERRGVAPDGLLPRVAGHAALAIALSAYEQWLDNDASTLGDLLLASGESLRSLLAD
jgi:mycofactocin system transcriptional regulator